MTLDMIAFTADGAILAERLLEAFRHEGVACTATTLGKFCRVDSPLQPLNAGLQQWTKRAFAQAEGIIFIGACGIAVRAIAPWLVDKMTDPAVVSLDEQGHYAIALLSGHVGGANQLAQKVAQYVGATAIISTATDLHGIFAVDVWAKAHQCHLENRQGAKKIAAALLQGQMIPVTSETFELPEILPTGLCRGERGSLGIVIDINRQQAPFAETVQLIPRIVTLGIGCRKGVGADQIATLVESALAEHRLAQESIRQVCSIDLKAAEPGLLAFCAERGWPLTCFTAEILRTLSGDFSGSDFVRQITGVDNVCERAALQGSRQGRILHHKQSRDGVTVALVIDQWQVDFTEEVEKDEAICGGFGAGQFCPDDASGLGGTG